MTATRSARCRGGRRLVVSGASALLLLTLTGCGANGSSSASTSGVAKDAGSGGADAAAAAEPATVDEGAATGEQAMLLPGRSLQVTAQVSLLVDDVDAARGSVSRIATWSGGYVAAEQTQSDARDARGAESGTEASAESGATSTLTLRVPTSRAQDVIDRLRGLGAVQLLTKQVEDVTQQVVDVDARVQSARASVERIRALLARAQTIGQVVSIESELAQREAQMESLLAQQRALADSTNDATITATLHQRAGDKPAPVPATGFIGGLRDGWHAFGTAASAVLMTVGFLLPFALVAAVLALVGWPLLRRVRRTSASSPAA